MIMTSDREQPGVEIRRSKFEIRFLPREFRVSNFEFPVSSFQLKLILLLTVALGLCAWARPAFATERVWEKRFELPPGGHVSVVTIVSETLARSTRAA